MFSSKALSVIIIKLTSIIDVFIYVVYIQSLITTILSFSLFAYNQYEPRHVREQL